MADELALKLVVVGNGAVGKSSLIQRFCRGVFSQNYKQTIGKHHVDRLAGSYSKSVVACDRSRRMTADRRWSVVRLLWVTVIVGVLNNII